MSTRSPNGAAKVCIAFASGCPRNQVDTVLLHEYFRVNGWMITQDLRQADLAIVATCGVDTLAARQSIALLAQAKKRIKADAKLIATGCLPGIEAGILEKRFGAVCIAPKDVHRFDQEIGATVPLASVADPNELQETIDQARSCFTRMDRLRARLTTPRDSWTWALTRAGLKSKPTSAYQGYRDQKLFEICIARGCMGECSYCAIRNAAGPLKSKPRSRIMDEFRLGLSRGGGLIRLIAGDVGAWGQDIGDNIASLLAEMFAHEGRFRLSLIDFNVEWLYKYRHELRDALAGQQHRIDMLQSPVQSGSDRLLSLMRRPYTADQAREAFACIRQACPMLMTGTHIMVGFPGETDQDVDQTIALVRDVDFFFVDIYQYSDRPGTDASAMPGKVPAKVRRERVKRLRKAFPRSAVPQEV